MVSAKVEDAIPISKHANGNTTPTDACGSSATLQLNGKDLALSLPSGGDEEEAVDTRCGYTASCKPKWLQVCANPKAYLVVASLCAIMQGMKTRRRFVWLGSHADNKITLYHNLFDILQPTADKLMWAYT